MHKYLRYKYKDKMPKTCESCGELKKLDCANISGKYTRNIEDYKWLCRKCHCIYDKNYEKRKRNEKGQFS